MSTSVVVALIISALVVIGLSIYAGKLLFMLKMQNERQQAVRDERIASIQTSIQTIAFAMQQQQCDLSEGVIRICNLLDALPLNPLPDYAQMFPSTYALYEKVKAYPTHAARDNLLKSVRRAQDKQREQFESELESAILIETEALRNFEAKG